MQLEFKATSQIITRLDNEKPVENSQGYLYAHFEFSEDWNVVDEKYALFTHDENATYICPLDESNTCLVPSSVIKACSFRVWVKGVNNGKDILIPSSKAVVNVISSGELNGKYEAINQIISDTLDYEKKGGLLTINIPKNKYGTSLAFDEENQIIKLLGRDNEVLSQVDLPIEHVVDNVTYDESNNVITIYWVNGQSTTINLSNLIDTYKADEETLTLNEENKIFSIKPEFLDSVQKYIDLIYEVADVKQNKLIAGSNIKLEDNDSSQDVLISVVDVAPLDGDGKIPSSYLPSYVDDVVEYPTMQDFPTTGESGKIYIDKTTNLTYRWSGTQYTEISKSLALGETASTAYSGDKGKKNHEDIFLLKNKISLMEKKFHDLKINSVTLGSDEISPDENTSTFYTYPTKSNLDNQSYNYFKIISANLTDKDIEAIKQGRLYLCMNYLLKSSSKHSSERYGFSDKALGNLFDAGLIEIKESNIKNRISGKVVELKIDVDELLIRMLNASRSDKWNTADYDFGGLRDIQEAIAFNKSVKDEFLNDTSTIDYCQLFFNEYDNKEYVQIRKKIPIKSGTSSDYIDSSLTKNFYDISSVNNIIKVSSDNDIRIGTFYKPQASPVCNIAFMDYSFIDTPHNNPSRNQSYYYAYSGLYSCENFYRNTNILSEIYYGSYQEEFYLPNITNVKFGDYGYLEHNELGNFTKRIISRYARNLKTKFNFVILNSSKDFIEFKCAKFHKVANINYRAFTYFYNHDVYENNVGCLEYVAKLQ